MPSFQDSIFLFVLALLLLGPKKLPVLARELGKWVGEFRRASNEFKMQMEEELRQSEQEERRKQIASIEAAAPLPSIEEPEHPHLPSPAAEVGPFAEETAPVPIATSGELSIMPPATGLPVAQSNGRSAVADLVDSVPDTTPAHVHAAAEAEPESVAHGG